MSRFSREQARDALVGLVDDPPHLAVDQLLRGLGDLRDARQQRALRVGRDHGDRADRVAHPPAADHLARDPGELLDVGLRARGDRAVDELLGDPAAERDLDPAGQVLDVVVGALVVGARDRHAQRHRARDDRDLAHRVRARREHADDRVARLVVGGAALLLVGQDDPARRAEDDLLQRVGEVPALHLVVPAARGQQRRLVGEVRDVGADHAGRDRGDVVEVDVVVQRQRARVDLEDLAPAVLVGRRDGDAAVEAAGPQQRGVEDLGAVGRRDARSPCRPARSRPSR